MSGQLAGAGATKILAAFGAEVLRVEDPATQGLWDALRGVGPYVDERRGVNFGAGFNNHNVGKYGVTINMRTPEGKDLLRELISISDVVCENFAAGVLDKRGFGYAELQKIKADIIYVSNCGFGHTGPYRDFKTWGPIVQAMSGLTFTAGLPDAEPAGWGFSYMDHMSALYMTTAILAALHHRDRTGEGQHVDLATVPAGIAMLPTEVLDWTVNGRAATAAGNRADFAEMAPHGIYPCAGADRWIAIACRDERELGVLAKVLNEPELSSDRFTTLEQRVRAADELDALIGDVTASRDAATLADDLVAAGLPASMVKSPSERIDDDPDLAAMGLFPTVTHPDMGEVRVEGIPMRCSATPWQITSAAPRLGQHNREVLVDLLGHSEAELDDWAQRGVI
ncbi:L-carnitine dehydratase/bile acid-inducible protein F [Mycolicibacterium novocastrense]|uniref:L-carnitine dehydratase/bile acid-inducible protein F n=1 Tax=Mycolicibacterium novocastrense TaxID=59813 RepID=A0ABQ0KDH7_MYCNV|nr:L-carnitine dehydratase/bile acid-inducible protein F [Mycolicibacterium novocastrense]